MTVISAKPLPCGILKSPWSQKGALKRLQKGKDTAISQGPGQLHEGHLFFCLSHLLSVWKLVSQQRNWLLELES